MTHYNHIHFPILNIDDEENYSPEEDLEKEEVDKLKNNDEEEDDYNDYNYEE